MKPEEVEHIQDLVRRGMSIRAIARKLGRDVKTIRRILRRPRAPKESSKIARFLPALAEKARLGLRAPRISRELKSMGYTGSHSLVKKHLRRLRPAPAAETPRVQRFETDPGRESQVDWSVYRVKIAGRETAIHAFCMVLNFSRALFATFCRDEKLPTLLHAHVEAFAYLGGVSEVVLYDNMTTVTLGRSGGRAIWNEAFLEFARYYGFRPKVCRPRHPERKGRVERVFHYLETDFLAAREFASWDDLHAQTRTWLDEVANPRIHGTTGESPMARLLRERPLLIPLPDRPYATERRETRKVERDGSVQVLGSFFPAPGLSVGSEATVAISPGRVSVLAPDGRVVASYAIPERPTRILPAGGLAQPRPPVSRSERESRFLARFPGADAFLDGLLRRHKTLVSVHLVALDRLFGVYGDQAVREAVGLAQAAKNFNAHAVARILEHRHPDVLPDVPPPAPWVPPHVLGALDDVDGGSPSDYPFDGVEPTDGGGA